MVHLMWSSSQSKRRGVPDTESQDPQESPGNRPVHPESLHLLDLCWLRDVQPGLTAWEVKSLPSLPRSRPPKEDAFEDFKIGKGNKINCIFTENKAVLLERRSLLQQLTEEVSGIRREIDLTTATMQQHKELRGGRGTSSWFHHRGWVYSCVHQWRLMKWRQNDIYN